MYFEELVARAKEAAIKEKKRAAKAAEAFTEALRGTREVKAGMSWDDARPLLASHRHFQGVRARFMSQARDTVPEHTAPAADAAGSPHCCTRCMHLPLAGDGAVDMAIQAINRFQYADRSCAVPCQNCSFHET